MLKLKDGRIYTGHTNSPPRRTREHVRGKGSRTTRIFGAGEIIHVGTHLDRCSARNREAQIKRWTRAKKEALAAGDKTKLKQLAGRRASAAAESQ